MIAMGHSSARPGRSILAVLSLAAGLLVAACGVSSMPGATAVVEQATTGRVPSFSHIYMIVLENEAYGALAGDPNAAYFNSLIPTSGLALDYFAVAHPSQPNYLALFSGSTQGVTDDAIHQLTGRNLADQLEAKGKTWAIFAQDYPGNCFDGESASGNGEGIGMAGDYIRSHNPAISFDDIRTNSSRCAQIMSLSHFDPAAADFELIVPNECNDMHSCSIAVGDQFLRLVVPRIVNSPTFANSLLVITADEGTTNQGGGGRVTTLLVSPLARPGFTSAVRHDHYSLLRTIEDSWNLGCLGRACSTPDMEEFFRPGA